MSYPTILRLGVIATVLVAWEVSARLFGDPLFVCPPSLAVAALGRILADPGIDKALLLTLGELAAAFVIAVAVGTFLGLVLGLHGFTRGTVYPIILLLYAVPQATVLPVFVLLLGIGPATKITFGVTHGMFPIAIAIVGSAQSANRALAKTAHSMGATGFQVLRYVVFPHIVPSFFTGMRLCMAGVLLGVILAELYASSANIGYYARAFAETFKPPELFALVGLLSAMAIVFNELCRLAERHFRRWQG
jgi:ABC-type nitrate/sulfonate/bicarbonate transport system permease component